MSLRLRLTPLVLALASSFVLVGCPGDGGNGGGPPMQPNERPTASISSPSDGATFTEGDQVTFEGSGSDPEDGSLTGSSLTWESSQDGGLGTGETVQTSSLSTGDHTITLTAEDSEGATGTDQISITVEAANQPPSASISSPADGATFTEGDQVTFEGSGSDPEDGSLTGSSLTWESSQDGQLGTGETVQTSSLSTGTHTITLTAEDSEGATGTDQISITVEAANQPPSASISSPADGATFTEGDQVTFQGSGSDPEDGSLTGSSLTWSSDIDGQLGTGETVQTSSLSTGTHTITLTAEDSEGTTGTDQISITVQSQTNSAPSATIDQPADGATFTEGDQVTFEGSGSDPEDGSLTGSSLTWESSQDGQLGTGETVQTSSLSTGDHTITLTAEDSEGATGTDQITITVEAANQPPSASISAPADGATFAEGESITFQGSGSDPEDGALQGGALTWDSSQDGAFGMGGSVTTSSLSPGDHTITLTARDSDGATATDQITITIEQDQAPSATISSPSDGASFNEGDQVTFEGSGSDPEDGSLTGSSLTWSSDIDGQLGTGETVQTSSLSTGTHTITLTAEDSEGATGTDQISITVEAANQPPSASISSPSDGASFTEGDQVTFEGSGSDPEDGSLTGSSLTWSSDIDGQLGTGETVQTSSLSTGTHTITLTAEDSEGATGTDQISITVQSQMNSAPSASISSPGDETVISEGNSISFQGSGSDPDGDMLTLTWESDVEGQIGTGESFSTTLPKGPHTITLTVEDPDGATGTATIDILVESPGFDIRLDFGSGFSSSQMSTIRSAVERWESVVQDDLSHTFTEQLPDCLDNGRGIDDLFITVTVADLGGSGGTLARAGPCAIRTTGAGLPIGGTMEFDQADLSTLESDGRLDDVALHEAGHVLGVGTLTSWNNMVQAVATLDPFFSGSATVSAYGNIGGEAYLSDGVPLANQGGQGTRSAHWREVNFEDELMTGFIGTGANPLSTVTVASLQDMGYTADMSAADSYGLPMPQVALWLAVADATLARPQDSGTNFGTPGSSTLSETIVAGTNQDAGWEGSHPDDELYTGLVQFESESLPAGVSIDRALLTLTVRNSDPGSSGQAIDLAPVDGGWSEGSVTWDGRPAFGGSRGTYDGVSCSGPCRVTITSLVTSWADGSRANNGIALSAPDASASNLYSVGYWTRHSSTDTRRPRIRVEARTGSSAQAALRRQPIDHGDRIPLGDDVLDDIPLWGVNPDGSVVRIR